MAKSPDKRPTDSKDEAPFMPFTYLVNMGASLAGQLPAVIGQYSRALTLVTAGLLAQPSHPSASEEARVEVVSESNSLYGAFSEHLKSAKKTVRSLKSAKALNEKQKAVLELAENYPDHYALALCIKESRLQPDTENGGYLQLTSIAIQDLEDFFGDSLKLGSVESPQGNLQLGLLYLALLQVKYVDTQALAKGMSPEDRMRISHFFYNFGPSEGNKLWKEIGATNLADFEYGVAETMGDKIDTLNSWGFDFSGPSSSTRVKDENYKVDYLRHGLEQIYLDMSNKQTTGYEKFFDEKVKKAAISLRYLAVTGAIAEKLKDADGKRAYLKEMGYLMASSHSQSGAEEYNLESGDTFWSLSSRHGVSIDHLMRLNPGVDSSALRVGQSVRVPSAKVKEKASGYLYKTPWVKVSDKGFWNSLVEDEAYKSYLEAEVPIDSEDIVEVVMDFNNKYNPELRLATTANLPKGSYVWVPTVEYFIAYLKGENSLETATEVEGSFEVTADLKLSKYKIGQYVKNVQGKWILDADASKEGDEKVKKQEFSDHPKWVSVGDLKRQRFASEKGLEDVRYIILHSTISPDSNGTIRGKKAHFVIEKDGTIKNLVSVNRDGDPKFQIPPHAGVSRINGDTDLNRYAIGIEVVAEEGKEWSDEQFKAVKALTKWLLGYYELKKRDVLTHYQIASSSWGRGRKSDPFSVDVDEFWQNLDLPPNSNLLDLAVAQGKVKANLGPIEKDSHHHNGAWPGLKAAEEAF